jgi:YgiT-type zinc finger domain-containing protein
MKMATCHECGRELKEGVTTLTFHENGLVVSVSHIPALVCECGEVRIKAPVAEYVSDLVDEILAFERAQHKKKAHWIPVHQIALDFAVT